MPEIAIEKCSICGATLHVAIGLEDVDHRSVHVEATRTGRWRADLFATDHGCHRHIRIMRRYYPTKFDAEERADLWRGKYGIPLLYMRYAPIYRDNDND